MKNEYLDLAKAYSSQYEEISRENLAIEGEVPSWLSGSFVSNGPAQFEVGSTHFSHWFDGFAMLKKFDFEQGVVHFQNRFLHSNQYTKSNILGRLNATEFATYASNSILGRILSSLKGLVVGSIQDNCLVNTTFVGGQYIAMTETKELVSFKLNDLSTNGAFKYQDALREHLTTAHPQLDINTHELINISIELGRSTKYHVYRVEPGTQTRKIITTYKSQRTFYIHSFSVTKNYIILFKSPLTINKLKLIGGWPFNNTISYLDNVPSYFVIINRHSGDINEIETDPFVCLHSINAYEQEEDHIILDLICYGPGNPYNSLYLSNLRSNYVKPPIGEIRRFSINPHLKCCKGRTISTTGHEFPRINYMTCNGNPYQYIYTTVLTKPGDPFFKQIQKTNLSTATTQSFSRAGYYFAEAIFVPKPKGDQEDDGVLLFLAFNTMNQTTSLFVLDAIKMDFLAEIKLPIHLPLGLHGNFYRKNVP